MKPPDIPAVYRLLRRHHQRQSTPVADFQRVRTNEPFRVLVAAILSARTRDETTAEVSTRLFRHAHSLRDLRRFTAPELEQLIFPVGFYRTKARMLRRLPDVADELFGGRIPETVEELVQLPGVGRKVANLVVAEAFGKPGICVDVHVHRITNRLGLLRTKTPFETEMALRHILPPRYWRKFNPYLVGFGQTICLPARPRCGVCPLYTYCDRRGVKNAVAPPARRTAS